MFSWSVPRDCVTAGEPKWVSLLGEGVVQILECTKVSIALGNFVILLLIRVFAFGPLGLSARR